jgi:phage tail sheath protein FI
MATVQYKTPGVYLSEPDSFPPAIVGVETAIPAFIGYTAQAKDRSKDLNLTPTRISSMAEYIAKFGGSFRETYRLLPADAKRSDADRFIGNVAFYDDGPSYQLIEDGTAGFYLFSSMALFYANGGGECYVVSVGTYYGDVEKKVPAQVTKEALSKGLGAIRNVVGPTMLVIPDAILIGDKDECYALQVEMLRQCNAQRDRVALLDIWGADRLEEGDEFDETIEDFRRGLAGAPRDTLRYGMAYFPNLKTSLMSKNDVNIGFFEGDALATLTGALSDTVGRLYPAPGPGKTDPRADRVNGYIDMIGKSIPDSAETRDTPPQARTPAGTLTHSELTQALLATLPPLNDLFSHVADAQNNLPPSPAMAGVYTTVDSDSGVWNAPANRGIATLVAPTTSISNEQQEDLNAPTQGLAVNAIRNFPARGPLIWGARTLDSTSNDWKYIQVRRAMIYIESSVKTALNAFVFAPNTASTWTTVESMIESFLHGVWAAGGLMGASPGEAYSVSCGLGKTMTADDILAGNMIVHVVLTMVHPAEFIELVFKQQMLGGA